MVESMMMNPMQELQGLGGEGAAGQAPRVEGMMGLGFGAALDDAMDDERLGGAELAGIDNDREAARAEVRQAAEQLVASAFVLPMLAKVRDDPLGSDLFHGGVAEDLFGQQLDTYIADAMVGGMNSPMVDAVERYMMGDARQIDAGPGRQVNVHG